MALTEVEERLLESFIWLGNVHHEVLHKRMQELGATSFETCDARTCKHTAETVAWCRQRAEQT